MNIKNVFESFGVQKKSVNTLAAAVLALGVSACNEVVERESDTDNAPVTGVSDVESCFQMGSDLNGLLGEKTLEALIELAKSDDYSAINSVLSELESYSAGAITLDVVNQAIRRLERGPWPIAAQALTEARNSACRSIIEEELRSGGTQALQRPLNEIEMRGLQSAIESYAIVASESQNNED